MGAALFSFLKKNEHEVTAADLAAGLRSLGLDGTQHLMVHASLRSFGRLEGGEETLLNALEQSAATLLAPAFTYGPLLEPWQRRAYVSFSPEMPPSRELGRLPRLMLQRPQAKATGHPVLRFVALGVRAPELLASQTRADPYAPVGELLRLQGHTLMIGTDWESATALHWAERAAGLPYLEYHAQDSGGVVPINFPNCSANFAAILKSGLRPVATAQVGQCRLQLHSLPELMNAALALLEQNPSALLCRYRSCRCQTVRQMVEHSCLSPRSAPPGQI